MSTSGARTETYAWSTEKAEAIVVPRVGTHSEQRSITHSEQIARYFTEDLTYFLQETGFSLLKELQIPTEYARSNREVVEMLYDDLAHMLRARLITGIHLLLAEPRLDPNSQAYPLRYHAMYLLEWPAGEAQSGDTRAMRLGGHLAPPKQSWAKARFALLIDWDRSATDRRREARRPEYCFDWVAEEDRYDDTTVIRYREGNLTSGGRVIVQRREAKSSGFS